MDENFAKSGSPAINLIEECAELIKELSKAKRFGWSNYHPKDPDRMENGFRVLREMDDVKLAMDRLEKSLRRMGFVRRCKKL